MGAGHLPFGSAGYFQLDNYGPFILTICAWMEYEVPQKEHFILRAEVLLPVQEQPQVY
jgi:hypothetical protein